MRWLDDRKGIEKPNRTWNKVIVDRNDELAESGALLAKVAKRGILIYGYANSHYAEHGPASVKLFRELWAGQMNGVTPQRAKTDDKTLFANGVVPTSQMVPKLERSQ